MFKSVEPWEWSPDNVRGDMRGHLDGCVYFAPMWETSIPTAAGSAVTFDYVSRNTGTVRTGGTLSGAVSKSYGNAIRTGSSTGGIDIGFDPLGGASEFTVMAAIDLEGVTPSNSGIFGLWSTGDIPFLWRVLSNRAIRCIAGMSGGNADISGLNLASAGLEVVTARFDGTTLNQFQGSTKSGISATSSGTLKNGTANWFIGGDKDAVSQAPFGGCFAGVIAWNRALSDTEVATVSQRFFDLWEPDDQVAHLFSLPAAGGGFAPAWAANSTISIGSAA